MAKHMNWQKLAVGAALLSGLSVAGWAWNAGAAPPRPPVDFDGDRVSDFAVLRSTGGGITGAVTWFMLRSDELGAARPLIRSIARTGNQVRLVFTTQTGSNYALQAIGSPTQTTWTTLGGVVGSGLTQTNVVTPPSGATMNFRLLPN